MSEDDRKKKAPASGSPIPKDAEAENELPKNTRIKLKTWGNCIHLEIHGHEKDVRALLENVAGGGIVEFSVLTAEPGGLGKNGVELVWTCNATPLADEPLTLESLCSLLKEDPLVEVTY